MSGSIRRITIPVTLHVQGPVLTRSSSIGAPGVDAPMASGPVWNATTCKFETRYYLPGRLVKGLLREAWQELRVAELDKWLGAASPSSEESDDAPARERVALSDFADWATEVKAHELRYRIQIDEMRGAATGAMMQVIDSPYAPLQPVTFRGELRFLAWQGENTASIEAELLRGLAWIRAVGGVRTSGFGELLGVEFGNRKEEDLDAGAGLQGPVWSLRLSFQELLILAKQRIADNLFESSDILPGGALKGAVAQMMGNAREVFRELENELHAVRFTHAFPTTRSGPRPTQWPLSLVAWPGAADGKAAIFDAIEQRTPQTRDGVAGAFDIDWKAEVGKLVSATYGWPEIERELRVRTGIDSSMGKAKDQDLFAWQMLRPEGVDWLAKVEVSALSPPAREQLERLLRFGIEPLGKTKALAKTRLEDSPAEAPAGASQYVVTLQTAALLLDPGRLAGATKEEELAAALESSWEELSEGALRLRNYFQRTTLAGGRYFQKRFQSGIRTYKPYLLCNAGSTFALVPEPGRESEALACVVRWARHGLPLPGSVLEFYELDGPAEKRWERCPYLPENGYGEILVNEVQRFPAL